jgi:signal transduction histidine kinase
MVDRVRILIIEDDPAHLRLIRELLVEAKGMVFDVVTGDSLATGLQVLARGGVDVVLLDLGLPDSVGLETVKRFYARGGKPPVLIVMSIVADEELAVQAVGLGAQDYWIKGLVDTSAVTRSVRYAIERARAEEALKQARADLENRVKERTAELGAANDTLRAEMAERKRLEGQLLQAQKLESLGRLAGGIAHDFNNLLTAILGYSEVLLLRKDPSLATSLGQIKLAADRAARLTSQLLLFARRGVVEAVVLDLNDLTHNISQLLRRLIGEDVELMVRRNPQLWATKADAGQVEQVLLNLGVNARDAMPRGGRLTIATDNAEVGEPLARDLGMSPGAYVVLTVADNGTGMTEETKAHLFEPFYTTKEPGKGTGLGLATSHGIIKQCGGYIFCSSERGKGTTFTVYFPRFLGHPASVDRAEDKPLSGGTETLLVVEDEPLVRSFAVRVLTEMGYRVLEAANGLDALSVAEHAGRIDLVITDVVMPKMGGTDLAEKLRTVRPELRVLYTSGYTDDQRIRLGSTVDQARFLPKPFTGSALAEKVREILGGGGGGGAKAG